jgi:hypothetical protein
MELILGYAPGVHQAREKKRRAYKLLSKKIIGKKIMAAD